MADMEDMVDIADMADMDTTDQLSVTLTKSVTAAMVSDMATVMVLDMEDMDLDTDIIKK